MCQASDAREPSHFEAMERAGERPPRGKGENSKNKPLARDTRQSRAQPRRPLGVRSARARKPPCPQTSRPASGGALRLRTERKGTTRAEACRKVARSVADWETWHVGAQSVAPRCPFTMAREQKDQIEA